MEDQGHREPEQEVTQAEKKSPSVDDVVTAFVEYRDHIASVIHGEHAMEPSMFSLVAVKLLGFAFNTFKAIGLLLPDRYYEQGSALYRTLWESTANLAWVVKDPETRAKQFLEFTAVEYRRLLQAQVNLAAAGAKDASETPGDLIREYEAVMGFQLARFRDVSRGGRLRLRDRFSGPSLEAMIRDLGEPWTREYQLHYKLACYYTHGAPGAVLFPFLVMPEDGAQGFARVDSERTMLLALLSMDLIQRCLDLVVGVIVERQDRALEQIKARLWA